MSEDPEGGSTRVILVRHGQTALNSGGRIRGRLDPPLDEMGLRQAEQTAQYVASRWPVTAVYTSPLRRAVQTANAIARAQLLRAVEFAELLDLDFGKWHGLSFRETREQYPSLHQAWNEAPHTVQFPGGERLGDVRRRCVSGLDTLGSSHRGETIAMVGHAVVNRVILCAVIGASNAHFWRFAQDTCAVNAFTMFEDGPMVLELMNDSSHLASTTEAPSGSA